MADITLLDDGMMGYSLTITANGGVITALAKSEAGIALAASYSSAAKQWDILALPANPIHALKLTGRINIALDRLVRCPLTLPSDYPMLGIC